jgi:hypothetical protein
MKDSSVLWRPLFQPTESVGPEFQNCQLGCFESQLRGLESSRF